MPKRYVLVGGWYQSDHPSDPNPEREYFAGILVGYGVLEGFVSDLSSGLRSDVWQVQLSPEKVTFAKTYYGLDREPQMVADSTVEYEFVMDSPDHGRGRYTASSGASGVAEIWLREIL